MNDWRHALLAIYADADHLLEAFRCSASADCCHFAWTGREPSVTLPEWLLIERAVRSSGRRLTAAPPDRDGTCPFLSPDRRCRIYESRPLGCRTYFCSRAEGPGQVPRRSLQALVPRIRELSEALSPRDPSPAPMTSWLKKTRGRQPGGGGDTRRLPALAGGRLEQAPCRAARREK
ncbi:MAG: YkgJ family cysteine cluster protein [Deltaproteobacteria bacterium]|nr:YkgJ family cysteine cluster protein [Deltaproteobacteria bacterium]